VPDPVSFSNRLNAQPEHEGFTFRETSGPPWHISCAVEKNGPDFMCRIHGGDRHVGAVALSERRSGLVTTRILVVGRHREGEIARHAAYRPGRAARSSVVVIAGIHFDSPSKHDIEQIEDSVSRLALRAAQAIRNHGPQVPGGATHPV